jgi:ATP phosphoribosyltransferase
LRANGLRVLEDGLIHASQACLWRARGADWGAAATAVMAGLAGQLRL